MSLPWFRLYRELKDDPKIGALDDSTFRVFIESLCWACEKGEKGHMGLTEENASWAFRRNVTQSLQLLLQLKLLGKTNSGELLVTKWEKRQRASDFSAERVRKHRAKNVTLQTTLPKQQCNGLEERRGEEIRKDESESQAVELPPGFPTTADDAIRQGSMDGHHGIFITDVWNKAVSRGGCDAKGQPIRSFRHYLAIEAKYERERPAKPGFQPMNGMKQKTILEKEIDSLTKGL